MTRKAAFLAGLFVLCMGVLLLQIVETRVLSVISYYHLAFFAISMAMFGMTAGALIAYFNQARLAPEHLLGHLAWITSAFTLGVVLSTVVLISTVVLDTSAGILLSAVLWLKLIAALVPPYVFAGMGISLALTRSPWRIGRVYGCGLAGAAAGCLGALVLLNLVDGVSALFAIAALGAAAALLFRHGAQPVERTAAAPPPWTLLGRPGGLFVGLAIFTLVNAAIAPNGLALTFAKSGVLSGNLAATLTLAIIIALSTVLVVLTIVLPALPAARRLPARLIASGTCYFLLIGLGFMLVEIGVIQRLSIFLGHPVYGLALGLFGIIVATGAGSLLSDRLPLTAPARALTRSALIVPYLVLLPLWLPAAMQAFEANGIAVRAALALAAIAPAGVLMGFGFSTGMRLVTALDPRPTPWFGAINGAAGVLVAGLAVAISIAFSIDACIWLGAACYLPLGAAGRALMRAGSPAAAERPAYA